MADFLGSASTLIVRGVTKEQGEKIERNLEKMGFFGDGNVFCKELTDISDIRVAFVGYEGYHPAYADTEQYKKLSLQFPDAVFQYSVTEKTMAFLTVDSDYVRYYFCNGKAERVSGKVVYEKPTICDWPGYEYYEPCGE